MGADRHLDVNLAITHFLKNFERLERLPLVTDAEIAQLFGEEVSSALAELERFNRQEKICLQCVSRCCRLVDCELYSPEFRLCAIQPFRPVLCRMHFCQKFALTYNTLVKELGDIFLESLLAAEPLDKRKTALFDSPPLARLAPGLVAGIAPYITAFKGGRLNQTTALGLIETEAQKFHNIT